VPELVVRAPCRPEQRPGRRERAARLDRRDRGQRDEGADVDEIDMGERDRGHVLDAGERRRDERQQGAGATDVGPPELVARLDDQSVGTEVALRRDARAAHGVELHPGLLGLRIPGTRREQGVAPDE
jgi:hypothetical protein